MNVQDAANLNIPEGSVRNIHDKDKRLLWSAVGYNVRYDGDTTQQTYSGKNLFNKNATVVASSWATTASPLTTGVRVTQLVSSTASDYRWVLYTVGNTSDYVGKTLTLYTKATASSTNKPRVLIGLCNADGSGVGGSVLGDNFPATVSKSITQSDADSKAKIFVAFYASAGAVSPANAYVDYTDVQLEVGSSATTYEPYVGGIPAPNPDYPQDVNVVQGEQTVVINGKNFFLLPTSGARNNVTYTKNSNGSISMSSNNASAKTDFVPDYFPVPDIGNPGDSVTITISTDKPLPTGMNLYISGFNNMSSNAWVQDIGQFVGNGVKTSESKTVTLKPGITRLRTVVRAILGSTFNIDNVFVQAEIGSTATAYEMCQGQQTFPVDLIGKNLFSGWTIGKKLNASDGSEISDQNGAASSYIPVSSDTDYVFSGLPSGLYTFIAAYNSSKQFLGRTGANGGSTTKTFKTSLNNFPSGTPSGSGPISFIRITAYQSGQYADPITVINSLQTQLEVGTSATSYVPYYNYELCKIGNHQDYIFKSSGKNLVDAIDSTWQTNNVTLTKTDGIFRMTAVSGKIARAVLPLTGLIEGETYTISFDALGVSVSSDNSTHLRIREGSSSGEWIGTGVKINVSSGYVRYSTTFVATSVSDPWAWFYLSPSASNTNNVDIYVKNIQLEKGSTPTPYEPYGTDWCIHKEVRKYTFASDDDWQTTIYGTNSWTLSGKFINSEYDADAVVTMCEIGKGVSYNNRSSGDATSTCVCFRNVGNTLTIRNTTITTQAAMQSAAAGSDLYYWAVPYDTKITDNTLISQLNAIHDWLRRYDYYGVVSGNLPIIINRSGII